MFLLETTQQWFQVSTTSYTYQYFRSKAKRIWIRAYQTQNESTRGSQPTIFDISKVTLKLDFDDIKLLTIKTLNSQIDISKDEVKTLNNENQPESTDGYSQLINEDASYGLKTRSKGDKLSFDQISF